MRLGNARIVVGLDGSAAGRAALVFALHDAARRGATIEVVAAFDTAETVAALCGVPAGSMDSSTEDLRAAVRQQVAAIVEQVSADLAGAWVQPPPVTVTAVAGGATHTLLRAARGADLLVVGSRGRSGLASTVLGSVSMQCVLHATCPVTVVHPDAAQVAQSVPA